MMDYDLGTFPHCDTRVLHAPGECEYCDRRPEWQAIRKAWNIAFTGHVPVTDARTPWWVQQPCPSDAARGTGQAHTWGGNRPTNVVASDPPDETFQSKVMYGHE